jgi:hypothetical protein
VYGCLPTAREVNRVRLYLAAKNEYEYEKYLEQQDELDRTRHDSDGGEEGRRIRVG